MELKEVKKEESYWYPFSKGVNRILMAHPINQGD